MRSKILKEILDETPKEVDAFVKLYGDIVVRVHQILKEKGINQKDLAERLGKTPSEISKWLSGSHNFTLSSLSKLQSELEETIIYVPKKDSFHVQIKGAIKATTAKAQPVSTKILFQETKQSDSIPTEPIAA